MKKKLFMIFVMLLMLAGVTSCVVSDKKEKNVLTRVDQIIDNFVNNYAKNYLNKKNDNYTIDYNVLAGIYLLEESGYNVNVDDFISFDEIVDYSNKKEYTTINEIFVASVIDKVYGTTTEKAINALENVEYVDPWDHVFAVSALEYYKVNKELLNNIDVTSVKEEYYRDADYAGMALAVLENWDFDIETVKSLITNNITEDGISSWGTPNSCSTSYSIIGLLSRGINIDDNCLDDSNESLIENLLKYEKEGKFAWEINGVIDEQFATPQSFLALVAYKLYNQGYKKVEIF